MFHEKLKSTSFVVIKKRLFIVYVFEQHIRFHQMRIILYFKSSHQFFISSKISHIKNTLIFNIKYVDSKFMYQSIKIEINSFKNKNVGFFKKFRKCRHCKQFFIFENLFYKQISHCNKDIKRFEHVKKLNES